MLFLFLSMVTPLLIGTAVIGACEDRFERTFEEIGYEKDGQGCMGYLEGYRERSHPGVFFSFLVLIVLVVGIIAILALLLLASIFTKKNEPSCHGAVRLPG